MVDHIAALFRLEAGLLAFILAFYALCARERRAPYITHTVYAETELTLLAVLTTFIASLLPPDCATTQFVLRLAQLLVVLAILGTLWRVCSIANRDLHLRDDRWWLVIPLVRPVYLAWRRRKHANAPAPSYEHGPEPPDPELPQAVARAGWSPCFPSTANPAHTPSPAGPELSLTISLFSTSYHESDPHLLQLAASFLEAGATIQYAPCGRHPLEFLSKLHSLCAASCSPPTHPKTRWQRLARQIVVVDAYTPHYGFYESVHDTRTQYIQRQLGVVVLQSRPTFAGIHTATAAAFNLIRSRAAASTHGSRKPTLLLFETTYALVDLESPEQYRRFFRHVIPSERMWGSMFTLVSELHLDSDSEVLLRGYSDYVLDLPRPTPEPSAPCQP